MNLLEFLFEDIPVEEQECVERLVLGRGGGARLSQQSQEAFDLLLSGPGFDRLVFKELAVAAEPVDVGFFGLEGVVPEHTSFSY